LPVRERSFMTARLRRSARSTMPRWTRPLGRKTVRYLLASRSPSGRCRRADCIYQDWREPTSKRAFVSIGQAVLGPERSRRRSARIRAGALRRPRSRAVHRHRTHTCSPKAIVIARAPGSDHRPQQLTANWLDRGGGVGLARPLPPCGIPVSRRRDAGVVRRRLDPLMASSCARRDDETHC
jgi:hypothetical protein